VGALLSRRHDEVGLGGLRGLGRCRVRPPGRRHGSRCAAAAVPLFAAAPHRAAALRRATPMRRELLSAPPRRPACSWAGGPAHRELVGGVDTGGLYLLLDVGAPPARGGGSGPRAMGRRPPEAGAPGEGRPARAQAPLRGGLTLPQAHAPAPPVASPGGAGGCAHAPRADGRARQVDDCVRARDRVGPVRGPEELEPGVGQLGLGGRGVPREHTHAVAAGGELRGQAASDEASRTWRAGPGGGGGGEGWGEGSGEGRRGASSRAGPRCLPAAAAAARLDACCGQVTVPSRGPVGQTAGLVRGFSPDRRPRPPHQRSPRSASRSLLR
jgi:hypothetical protein